MNQPDIEDGTAATLCAAMRKAQAFDLGAAVAGRLPRRLLKRILQAWIRGLLHGGGLQVRGIRVKGQHQS